MTKDEMQRECEQCVEDCLHARFDVGVGNIDAEEWNEKVAAKNTAFDAYAQAAVDAALEIERNTRIIQEANHDEGQYEEEADTLGMLEALAERTGQTVVLLLPDWNLTVTPQSPRYWNGLKSFTRAEAEALLKGDAADADA